MRKLLSHNEDRVIDVGNGNGPDFGPTLPSLPRRERNVLLSPQITRAG